MKRIVDIYRKNQRDQVLWTYIVNLGGDGSHPAIGDFKQEGLRLAVLDKRGHVGGLDAFVRIEIIQ